MHFRALEVIGRTHSDLPSLICFAENMATPKEELRTERLVSPMYDKEIPPFPVELRMF